MSEVRTTVIGSYPAVVDRMRLMDAYFNGIVPSWNPVIHQAVSDMLSAGVDLVSDGQTKDPFIHIFARNISGCRIRKRAEVIGPVTFDESITKDDLLFVRSLLPPKKGLLGLLVGPFTLSQSVDDQYYHDAKQLAFDFAQVLAEEAKSIESVVDMISVDEPFFVNSFPEYASELLQVITQGVSCPVRLHACGDVSGIVSELVDLPVDILSHEFAASPQLFDVFSDQETDKMICLGAVRADQSRVESVDEIVSHLQKANDVFGDQIVQIAPDCGLRLLSRSVAIEKLTHLNQARRIVYEAS